MSSDFTQILYDVNDGVLTLTLNRPEKLNAFTGTMQSELIEAYGRADADDSVRVIVVTGAGRGFCAGADLSRGGDAFDHSARAETTTVDDHRDGGGKVSLAVWNVRKPIIAAINGPAVGVGITMTLPMDVRIASDKAKMGFVFTRRGIVPEACSSWFLPRVVGISQAMEWVMTGRVFSAEEALAGGLVSKVVPHEEILPTAYKLAREVVENTSPVAVALSRQMMWKMLTEDNPMAAHRIESKGIFSRGASADVREGVESFLAKRPAEFPMKPSKDMPGYYPWWQDPEFKE